jgi:hypothetical protein
VLAAPAGAAPCDARKSRTIRDDGSVRVYKQRPEVFACHRAHGARVSLGLDYDDDIEARAVHLIRVSGDLVGSVSSCSCRMQNRIGLPRLRVIDLRARRTILDVRAPYNSIVFFTDLVVGPGGAAAWILREGETYTVTRQAPGGEAEVLDTGTAIDGRGLVLADGRLYWRHAGENRTAALAP